MRGSVSDKDFDSDAETDGVDDSDSERVLDFVTVNENVLVGVSGSVSDKEGETDGELEDDDEKVFESVDVADSVLVLVFVREKLFVAVKGSVSD